MARLQHRFFAAAGVAASLAQDAEDLALPSAAVTLADLPLQLAARRTGQARPRSSLSQT